VLFEAMGSARPVVGMPMGAMPEYVADGQTGFMSPSIDAEGFAIAMERAWAAREQWRRMGEEARSYLAQHYDPNPQRTLLDIITA
jgi:glycosyltransferase involved in cell wall biosynthesis